MILPQPQSKSPSLLQPKNRQTCLVVWYLVGNTCGLPSQWPLKYRSWKCHYYSSVRASEIKLFQLVTPYIQVFSTRWMTLSSPKREDLKLTGIPTEIEERATTSFAGNKYLSSIFRPSVTSTCLLSFENLINLPLIHSLLPAGLKNTAPTGKEAENRVPSPALFEAFLPSALKK